MFPRTMVCGIFLQTEADISVLIDLQKQQTNHKRLLYNALTSYSIYNRRYERLLSARCLTSITSSITATMITTPAITEITMSGTMSEFGSHSSTKQCNAITTRRLWICFGWPVQCHISIWLTQTVKRYKRN